MATNFHDLPELQRQQKRVVTVAHSMIEHKMGIIDGSRELCCLHHRVSRQDHDPDFLPFISINSETDHLPLGEERAKWAPEALILKDIEINKAEAHYRDLAFSGCHRLIERFSSSINSSDETQNT